ncbi:SDR family oxidoreductase [Streptomyces sp. NBC_01463]
MSQTPTHVRTTGIPSLSLQGRRALVTGGGTGIGAAVAVALADAGADVALTYKAHDGRETAERIAATGRRAHAEQLDATDPAAVEEAVSNAAEQLQGPIDILINNAGGLVGRHRLVDMPDEHWHTVLNLNLTSAFLVTRAVVRRIGPGGGRIVNISSQAARNGGGPGASAYAAAKAGMHGLMLAWAKEFGPRNITVNTIAPGFIGDTPFHATFTPPETRRAVIESTPLRRAGVPEDVAGAVLYLASDLGGFCTGEIIDVNGGAYL